jgi:hypothetical protein
MVSLDLPKNGAERPSLQRSVIRDGEMVLTVFLCRKPDMVTGLATGQIAEAPKRLGKLLAIEVSG